jgi:hypothetical protein
MGAAAIQFGLQPLHKDETLAAEGSKMSDISREEIKAHIDASEARGETKIARLEGKLDLVLSRLNDVNENVRSSKANQWVIGLGLAVDRRCSCPVPGVFRNGDSNSRYDTQ